MTSPPFVRPGRGGPYVTEEPLYPYYASDVTEGGIALSWGSIITLIMGLGCAGIVGGIAWFIYWGLSVGSRPSWQGHAEQIIRRSRAAHSQVRQAINGSPKHLRRTLGKALKEADRLLQRQQELRNAAVRIGRSMGKTNLRRVRSQLKAYAEKEAQESNPRVKSQYTQARKALEAQIAHYNAVGDKLRKILETMREIQGTLEAMQPRIVRLSMYDVDAGPDLDVAASHEIVEDLDLLIGELENIEAEDALLDMELIEREVEEEAQRRVAEGEIELEQDVLPPTETQ
ncbi:MAG: hypothetical protein GF320_00530 [Armatimonadia bacterium]|nr:hypothetical protein [Armatimonadia bacterium]